MYKILTSRQMKECDIAAIEAGTPSRVLMERAAHSIADAVINDYFPEKTLIVCGSGNNGGDGMIAARILNESGFECSVWYVGTEHTMTEETKVAYDELFEAGVEIVSAPVLSDYSLIVDAILGTGASFAPRGLIKEAIDAVNASGRPVLAVDIPSGISADTGKAPGAFVSADRTVTMQSYKRGHCFFSGVDASGKVSCADIGIVTDSYSDYDGLYPRALGEADLAVIPRRKRDSHKGNFGRVLVVAGSAGMCGAAYFSAAAAYRCGAGIVEILTAKENRIPLQTMLPEAIVTAYDASSPEADTIIAAIERSSVIVIGPGIGTGSASLKLLTTVFDYAESPLIVDADALNLISRYSVLFPTDVPVIITPHPGELSRLTGKSVSELRDDTMGSAMEYAAENEIICVSKFARTVITDGEELYINMSGGPSLSKGGSGDVLTGVIAGMLCCDLSPVKAAAMGAYIHGRAGDKTAALMGDYSPMASDVLNALSSVMMQAAVERNKNGNKN
ncbi:MAG: NAD(P)H-hydrate dehydratase [Clostridia bacterium]|nr:NAD(P)H-hydrate dehydratase [Clostridia bacterium]